MKIWIKVLVPLLGLISYTSSIVAQNNLTLIDSIYNMETVVVTATRTPKLLKNAPVITEVISAKEIEKVDATDMQELLSTLLAGVEFSFAMNQQKILNYQGFGGNKVLFLIDGNRMAGETMDNTDYSRMNLDNVERIEIVKGAASSLYGSQAMGAVVNIITKKPKKGISANVNARYGAFNSQRYGGNISFRKGALSIATSAQYNSIDEQKMKNIGDFDKVDANSSFSLKQNLLYTFSEDLKWRASLSTFNRTRYNSPTLNTKYYGKNISTGVAYQITEDDNLDVNLSFDRYEKKEFTPLKKSETLTYVNDQYILRLLYNHIFNEDMSLIVGGDGMRDFLFSYQFEDVGQHRQYSADIFSQFDWNITEDLNLLTALRYDFFSATKAQSITPKLSLMYKVLPYLRIRGSYASGFRSPTLKESYMVFNMNNMFMIYGNSNLKSEYSHNFQLSAEYARRQYNATLILHHSIISNRITTQFNENRKGINGETSGALEYINVDKMQISGLEASVSARYAFGLSARLSYVFTYEHSPNTDVGVKISPTRPHSAVLHLEYGKSWKYYGFNISINGRYLSPTTLFDYTGQKDAKGAPIYKEKHYEGYQLWDMNIQQKVWKGIKLSLKINNLLNYIPEFYGNNSPATTGITLLGGISLDLDQLI